MAKETEPGILRCDCGYQGLFFENTIFQMKNISRNSKQALADISHIFIFQNGQLIKAKKKRR